MTRVLVADEVAARCDEILRESGIEVERQAKISEADLTGVIANFEGVIVRSRIKITKEHLEAGRKLRIVGRAGAGVDNIDVATASDNGIVVANAPTSNTQSVAEHVFALLLSAARHIVKSCAGMKQGLWDRNKYMGVELAGKTIGIIGTGKIGRRVAEMARAWGLRVVANSPSAMRDEGRKDELRKAGIELLDLSEVLRESDFVTLHTPLNNTTRKMIGRDQLKLMKKSSILINTSRGGVIEDEALAEALKAGTLAAACLDVYEKEPPPADWPLLKLDNLITTPHLAASTHEAQTRAALDIAREFVGYFKFGSAPSAVNPQVLKKK
jgi:D-3-phosphoglycerate dehydrogenase